MRLGRAFLGFVTVTLLYVMALIWLDAKNDVFEGIPKLLNVLPLLLGFSLLSYAIRHLRWAWLLARSDQHVSYFYGLLAYLSGFAFTATPGKMGELMRIRYFVASSVPAGRVLAAFLYERAFDLLVVLFIASLLLGASELFIFVLLFVLTVLGGLIFVCFFADKILHFSSLLQRRGLKRLSHFCVLLANGLSGCRVWLTPLDVLMSVGLGLLAWGVTAFSFVCLLQYLEISIDVFQALGIYPLAMLAGAASMLPGGVGTTEASIVALLSGFSVPLGLAALAAIGIRLASLWFAVICGLVSIFILERNF